MHVLEHPIEKQREYAKKCGMSHAQWVEEMQKSREMIEEKVKSFQWGVRPDEFTDEDAKRFQAKIDSTHQ